MTTESAKQKIRALIEPRGFEEQGMKKDLFINNTGASKVGVDLVGDNKPIVGVFLNNKLEEEGHGISRIQDLRNEVMTIWEKEVGKGARIDETKPAPKPEPNILPGNVPDSSTLGEIKKPKGEVNKMEEKKELVPQEKNIVPITTDSGFLTPVTTIEDALSAFELFERAKTKLLKDTDVLWIGANGRPAPKGTGRPHIKRSGWRKLARFFGINCSIIDKEKIISEDVEGKFYLWKYRVRAQHIKGGFFEADGVGSSRDPFFSKKGGMRVEPDENDIMMKAQTVAFNRAISDLLGSGEVSADEIQSEETK